MDHEYRDASSYNGVYELATQYPFMEYRGGSRFDTDRGVFGLVKSIDGSVFLYMGDVYALLTHFKKWDQDRALEKDFAILRWLLRDECKRNTALAVLTKARMIGSYIPGGSK